MHDKHTSSAYWSLRIAFGVVPAVAGLDKFLGWLADWQGYLSPVVAGLLPFSPATFMHLVGIVELVVGLAILAGKARVFGFVASAWLALIALNLITTGRFLDVAARDGVMAAAAYALGRIAQVEESAREREVALNARPAQAHG